MYCYSVITAVKGRIPFLKWVEMVEAGKVKKLKYHY